MDVVGRDGRSEVVDERKEVVVVTIKKNKVSLGGAYKPTTVPEEDPRPKIKNQKI